jgi:hypothetical protein
MSDVASGSSFEGGAFLCCVPLEEEYISYNIENSNFKSESQYKHPLRLTTLKG